MKKNLTKKLMLSVLTLAFAVVSLGASTFAWFTTSENATVEQITYDVTSDAGLEVAVSDINGNNMSNYYIGTLPKEQIEKVVKGTGFETFNNVSYYDGVSAAASFAPNTFYQKATYKEGVATAGTAATDGYVAFQLNVRVDQGGWIKLNVPYLTSTGAEAWVAGVEYTANNNVKVLPTTAMTYDVLSASRLAVVPSSNTTLSQAFYQAAAATSNVVADAVDAPQAAANIGNTLGLSNKGALEIYNAKYDGEAGDIPAIPADLDGATPVAADAVNEFVFEATAGTVYEFEIYIWIEGYDAECANAIFAQKLSAAFSFNYDQDGDWTN